MLFARGGGVDVDARASLPSPASCALAAHQCPGLASGEGREDSGRVAGAPRRAGRGASRGRGSKVALFLRSPPVAGGSGPQQVLAMSHSCYFRCRIAHRPSRVDAGLRSPRRSAPDAILRRGCPPWRRYVHRDEVARGNAEISASVDRPLTSGRYFRAPSASRSPSFRPGHPPGFVSTHPLDGARRCGAARPGGGGGRPLVVRCWASAFRGPSSRCGVSGRRGRLSTWNAGSVCRQGRLWSSRARALQRQLSAPLPRLCRRGSRVRSLPATSDGVLPSSSPVLGRWGTARPVATCSACERILPPRPGPQARP